MLSHTPLPDTRVEKEAKFLKELGHQIDIICPFIRKRKKFVCFNRVWTFGSIKKLLIRTFSPNLIKNKFLFFDMIKKIQPDVLHAHDIVMATPSLLISQVFNIPLIFDSHEYWDLYSLSRFKSASFLKKVIEFMRCMIILPLNKIVAKLTKYFVVVNEVMAQHYEKSYKISPEKTVILQNVVDFDEISNKVSLKEDKDLDENLKSDLLKEDIFKVIYHGGLGGEKRPVWLLVKAMKYLKNKDIKLVLVGSKYEELAKLALNEQVSKDVHFTGFLTHDVLFSVIEKCNLGVVCINPKFIDGHISSFVKLYEYFSLGLPILSTNLYNLREYGDFITFWDSPKDLAEKIIELRSKKEYLLSLSAKVRRYGKQHDWVNECQKLKKIYEMIQHRRK